MSDYVCYFVIIIRERQFVEFWPQEGGTRQLPKSLGRDRDLIIVMSDNFRGTVLEG